MFYPQFYHSLTAFSNSTSWQIKLTRGTNLRSPIFIAVLHSNIPSTYFYFGNKGSWNIVEIVTHALSLYFSTQEKELSHDNCFRSFSFLFCRHISELKLIYDPNLLTRKYLIISFKNRNQKYVYRNTCLLYTSPSPRDGLLSRMPSSA